MGVDLHKKVGGGPRTRMAINRMAIWGIRIVVTKPPSSKYRGHSVFKYIQNFYFGHMIGT